MPVRNTKKLAAIFMGRRLFTRADDGIAPTNQAAHAFANGAMTSSEKLVWVWWIGSKGPCSYRKLLETSASSSKRLVACASSREGVKEIMTDLEAGVLLISLTLPR
jgi:hypothetical protein